MRFIESMGLYEFFQFLSVGAGPISILFMGINQDNFHVDCWVII